MQANPQFAPSELDSVSDVIYDYLAKPNAGVDLARTSYYRPLQRRFADMKPKTLKALVSSVLAEL